MAEYFDNDLDLLVEQDFLFEDFQDYDDQEEDHNLDHDIDLELIKQKNDTSAIDYRNGKDIQGIPWENLQYSREQYRDMRLNQYKNYENLPGPRDGLEKECKQVECGSTFYDFQYNTRLVKSTIMHFQEIRGSSSQPLSRVQTSTIAVKGNLIVVGGFQGELICKCLNQPGVAFSTRLTNDDAITNAVDIYCSPNGSTRVMAANNDGCVRIFDAEKFIPLNSFSFSWSVNSTSVSQDGKILAVLGDSSDCLLADPHSGKVIETLKGHYDYSFASAWHPSGQILATGNQDKTCRLWDVRNLSESLAVLKGRIGAIRNIKYSSDGRFMAMAEDADFVHIYDAGANYCNAQEIDLFGEIGGISFSPDTDSFFVSVADRNYGSLLEFRRRRQFYYLDSFQ